MPLTTERPLAVYYEHPDWFRPLFAELERRAVPYVRLHADERPFGNGDATEYGLVFNRMSPSAYRRGRAAAVFEAEQALARLEAEGIRVVNGLAAYRLEISKSAQVALLDHLGLPYPATAVVRNASEAASAARGMRFPVVVKPDVGGSGAGIVRYDTLDALAQAGRRGGVDLGPSGVGLVQEYVTPADGRIVRVETLGGRYLYAIRVYTAGNTFNLCPADVCRTVAGVALARNACPVDAPQNDLRVEGYEPPPEVVREIERIAGAAGLDVGGIEYLVDARDGRRLYYDINALSNFVADASAVVGFDPHVRLVDYLLEEAC